jgi:hypothetical protein
VRDTRTQLLSCRTKAGCDFRIGRRRFDDRMHVCSEGSLVRPGAIFANQA